MCPSGETCSTSNGTCGTSSTGPCTWSGGPSSSNGEITCYWFGQGTSKGGGCSSYKTYCGYCGTESGSSSGGLCPTSVTDSVANTATQYFAAFPVGTFGQGTYCGMCVQVTWQSKSITATIVDECATCTSAGHIDLSLSAAVALGLGQGGATADPTSGVTWKAVDCPVTGNIVGVFNGSSQEVYFQNVTFPVAKAVSGSHTATQQFGFWNFGAAVGGQSVTLTDTVGHVVTGTVPGSSGGSVGVQFPLTCQ
jgi:expansin (peptidoglycan-binding protein)